MTAVDVQTGSGAWAAVRGPAPGLAGLTGLLELYVADAHVGFLAVDATGEVRIERKGKPTALIATDSHETLMSLLRGELSPVLAHLQGRLRFEGDAALALRILFGLQEYSPWTAVQSGRPS